MLYQVKGLLRTSSAKASDSPTIGAGKRKPYVTTRNSKLVFVASSSSAAKGPGSKFILFIIL